MPDAKTVWLFCERLKGLDLMKALFDGFHDQLAQRGYVARAGQMIDATFVEAPRQRNSRDENALIKSGQTPSDWEKAENKAKLAQKDVDVRWTKKNEEKHFGYKNHVNVDEAHKLIQDYAVTDASVHGSQVFDQLLDHGLDEHGKKRAAYGDSAYRSQEREQSLAYRALKAKFTRKAIEVLP